MVLPDCTGCSCMIKVKNQVNKLQTQTHIKKRVALNVAVMLHHSSQVWIGGLSLSSTKGKVYIVDAERYEILKELQGHGDRVTALCSAEDRYVLSGAGKQDGKIAIWKVE